MANNLIQYTCCLIILTTFVDRGDGRWKKKDRESLQRDIELFRKMTDKIEYEIESFYDEYPDERLTEDNRDSLHYKYEKNTFSHVVPKNWIGQREIKQDTMRSLFHNKTNNVPQASVTQIAPTDFKETSRDEKEITNRTTHNSVIDESKISQWPKFDDILLAIGKRYDWKNDRWIKVKEKLKESKQDKHRKNYIDFHEKHKFLYKIVKLNKSKSRRNVVVAVSAVR